MLRVLGFLFLVMLCVSGVGYCMGWFVISTSSQGRSTQVSVLVDKQKINADETAAKNKLTEFKNRHSTSDTTANR